jgi:hypothetical protein
MALPVALIIAATIVLAGFELWVLWSLASATTAGGGGRDHQIHVGPHCRTAIDA